MHDAVAYAPGISGRFCFEIGIRVIRRRATPAAGVIARAGPGTAPVLRSDFGCGHSLRPETAWLFASPPAMRAPAESHPSLRSGLLRSASRRHLRAAALRPRSRPPLAIRRPSTTIRQDRSRSQAHRSRHRRPCRAPAGADSFLHSRPVAFAPLPHLRVGRSRSTPGMTLKRRWAAGARSRCAARASVVCVA